MASATDHLRHALNWLNLTTPLGLAVARLGGARIRRTPARLFAAEGYRPRFPAAGAFTIGDVVITATDIDSLERRTPGVLGHERTHAAQYAVAGVWFLPAYLAGSAWSLLRAGDPATRNPLERHAGLVTGGYVHPVTGARLGAAWSWPRTGVLAWLRRSIGRSGAERIGSPDDADVGGAAS
ncbi:MAG: hypothetical protein ACLGHZ_05995 [Actinomycetes bacterium]